MEVSMFFTYHDEPYCINCDWLQYSLQLYCQNQIIHCPEGYRVELCQGTNVFKRRALVFDREGRKVLTLCWEPYSSQLNPLLMTAQVSNHLLYTGGIEPSLTLVKEIFPDCYYNAVGRFDLCCDFRMTDKRMQIFKHLNSGHIYVERKTEGSGFWHAAKAGDYKHNQHHCLSWGSKHSEIKVKLYNKSRELGLLENPNAQCEKPWIVNEWKLVGLDPSNTWRLEFSLRTNGQMRSKEDRIMLPMIANPDWLLGVYSDLYSKRFVTRYNQGKGAAKNKESKDKKASHHNTDRRVYLLDLPSNGEKIEWQKPLSSGKNQSIPAVTLLRSLLNQVENEALLSDPAVCRQYAATIREVVYSFRLIDYMESRTGMECNEFLRLLESSSGEGVREKIMSIAQLID